VARPLLPNPCALLVERGTRAFESTGFEHHDERLAFGRAAESKVGFAVIEFPDAEEWVFLLCPQTGGEREDRGKHRKKFQRHS